MTPHPQPRKLFVLQCQTCKNSDCPIFANEKDRYFIQEKSWCEEKYRDFVSKVNLCGCATHSSAPAEQKPVKNCMCDKYTNCTDCFNHDADIRQDEREKVLDKFKEWVIHDLIFCDSIGADHLFSHELILDKIARMQENRRQEGKGEQP